MTQIFAVAVVAALNAANSIEVAAPVLPLERLTDEFFAFLAENPDCPEDSPLIQARALGLIARDDPGQPDLAEAVRLTVLRKTFLVANAALADGIAGTVNQLSTVMPPAPVNIHETIFAPTPGLLTLTPEAQADAEARLAAERAEAERLAAEEAAAAAKEEEARLEAERAEAERLAAQEAAANSAQPKPKKAG